MADKLQVWWVYALLSAFFAALTTIFAKIGIKDVNSDLATAITGRAAAGRVGPAGRQTAWSSAVYLASVWRSRVFSETRVRLDARNTVDPLTGLSTLLVMNERVSAARNLIKRYGHPSVLLLVHLENLPRRAPTAAPRRRQTRRCRGCRSRRRTARNR